jgi:hypothetical protein
VYVTGTFDNWSKSEKLEKGDGIFQKTVTLPNAQDKIYYKVRSFFPASPSLVLKTSPKTYLAQASSRRMPSPAPSLAAATAKPPTFRPSGPAQVEVEEAR